MNFSLLSDILAGAGFRAVRGTQADEQMWSRSSNDVFEQITLVVRSPSIIAPIADLAAPEDPRLRLKGLVATTAIRELCNSPFGRNEAVGLDDAGEFGHWLQRLATVLPDVLRRLRERSLSELLHNTAEARSFRNRCLSTVLASRTLADELTQGLREHERSVVQSVLKQPLVIGPPDLIWATKVALGALARESHASLDAIVNCRTPAMAEYFPLRLLSDAVSRLL